MDDATERGDGKEWLIYFDLGKVFRASPSIALRTAFANANKTSEDVVTLSIKVI